MTLALSFGSPWWLLALLVIPVGIALYVAQQARRRQYALRFASLPLLASVMPKAPGLRRHVPPVLIALAVAALAFALAKPRHEVSVPRERASIMLVIDTSGSMAAEDVVPSRLQAARNAAASFLDQVPDQIRVGLTSFSSTASLLQTPTTDRDAVKEGLVSLQAGGSTATGDGIVNALKVLTDQNRGKPASQRIPGAIVLLSDGESKLGTDPIQAAGEAKDAKVPVYTVALGTPDGVLFDPDTGQTQAVPPDPDALRAIAATSGGKFFDAPNADTLQAAYKDLGSRLGSDKETREITSRFAGAGLLLLLGGALLGLAWFGRIP